MPRYLIQVSFTGEGAAGVLKEGGSGRREAVTDLVESVGGKLESMYFAFGEDDLFVIVEAPSNTAIAAVALTAAAGARVNVKTTVLLEPEEIDEAAKMSVTYRPPGR